jgi:hypothetical protein
LCVSSNTLIFDYHKVGRNVIVKSLIQMTRCISITTISEGHEPQNLQTKTAIFADVLTSEYLKNMKIQPSSKGAKTKYHS